MRKLYPLILGIALGTALTTTVLLIILALNQQATLDWPDWTGIGKDTVLKRSEERINGDEGSVTKVILTTETYSGKTLWNFLELASALAVPFLLLYLGDKIQRKDKEIAETNLREEAFQKYLDRISDLLIDTDISNLESDDSSLELIKDIIRTRTLTILRSFENDGERKGSVIKFLADAELLGGYGLINLENADLKNANLSHTSLSRIRLNKSDLSNADLSNSDLSNAELRDTNLSNANLSNACLISAELYGANLTNANLTNAQLTKAKLHDAVLARANFDGADVEGIAGLNDNQVKLALNFSRTNS